MLQGRARASPVCNTEQRPFWSLQTEGSDGASPGRDADSTRSRMGRGRESSRWLEAERIPHVTMTACLASLSCAAWAVSATRRASRARAAESRGPRVPLHGCVRVCAQHTATTVRSRVHKPSGQNRELFHLFVRQRSQAGEQGRRRAMVPYEAYALRSVPYMAVHRTLAKLPALHGTLPNILAVHGQPRQL